MHYQNNEAISLTRSDDLLKSHAGQINAYHKNAEAAAKNTIHAVLMAGKLLVEAKAMCEHGDWQNWLESNCEVSYRVAAKYMRLSENWHAIQSKCAPGALLTINSALSLIANPKPVDMESDPSTDSSDEGIQQPEFEYVYQDEAEPVAEGDIDCGVVETPEIDSEPQKVDWKIKYKKTVAMAETLIRAIDELNNYKRSNRKDFVSAKAGEVWEGLKEW